MAAIKTFYKVTAGTPGYLRDTFGGIGELVEFTNQFIVLQFPDGKRAFFHHEVTEVDQPEIECNVIPVRI